LFVLGFRPKGDFFFHYAGKERAALLAAAAVFSVVCRRGTNKSKLRILMIIFTIEDESLWLPCMVLERKGFSCAASHSFVPEAPTN
jgi:hypothetical protein